MKKFIFCLAASLLASVSVFAQSSEQISEIIKSEKATCAQISYLPALYANQISESDSAEQAFKSFQDKGLFDSSVSADAQVNLAQASYVYMQALGIKGGLFYSIFKSKRYAYKELKVRGILPNESDPSMRLSGRDSIDLFNSCLALVNSNDSDAGGER